MILALLLGGCAGFDPFNKQPAPTQAEQRAGTFDPALAEPSADDTFTARPRSKPAPPEEPQVARTPSDAQPGPALALLPDEIASDTVVGMAETDAERLFGRPHFVIRQQPALRWHYVTQTCTLDLFFFEDLETRTRRVLAYDVSGASTAADARAEPGALKACAEAIRTERGRNAG